MIWITMLTLQIGNMGNVGVISCLSLAKEVCALQVLLFIYVVTDLNNGVGWGDICSNVFLCWLLKNMDESLTQMGTCIGDECSYTGHSPHYYGFILNLRHK